MEDDLILNDSNEDISYLIWRISKFWQRGKHRTLDEFGLTGPQLELLGAIYHFSLDKKKMTQILLSQEMDVDPMTTSTILRNLQKKGLIDRRECEADTRARIVDITQAGIEVFTKAIEKVKAAQDILFRNIDRNALRTQLQILLIELNRLK